jgi:Pyruvate/2-oxoacid:ferredoxin oxidoreductase gamma subunit
MERTLLMTGIGGQGIQLAAQVLVRAALAEGREVQLFGSYGGMMRGGNTEAAIVVGTGPSSRLPRSLTPGRRS